MITINLLPEDIRENIAYSKKNLNVLRYIRIVIIACLLFLSSFGILYYSLSSNNNFFLKNIKESEAIIKNDKVLLDDAKGMKDKIKVIEKIKKEYKYWSKLNYIFNRITPAGIKVSSLELEDKSMTTVEDTTKKNATSGNSKMKLIGYAKTKNDVGIFRDIIAQQDGFKVVNIDNIKEDNSSNAGAAKNNFTISFVLEDSAIKKEAK